MRKRKIIENVEILDIEHQGKGVAKIDGKVIFVDKMLPGEVGDIQMVRNKKKHGQGIPIHIHQTSESRVEPFCDHFGTCGGCKWQHIGYEDQIKFKQYFVETAFSRLGNFEYPKILPIKGCDKTEFYRNKLEFSFTNRRWLTDEEIKSGQDFDRDGLGFHKPGGHDQIVDLEKCYLQEDPSNNIRQTIKRLAKENKLTFYDIRNKAGLLRSLFVRTTEIGDVMINLVVWEFNDQVKTVLNELREAIPRITSVNYVVNQKVNDSISDLEVVNFYGEPFIVEQLGHVKFKIGPKSFFQTNTKQAKVLYDVIKNFADLKGEEVVYDLYTGIGSIAMYLADQCKNVLGIEQLEEAVQDAYENAKLNGIENCHFIAGDVKDVISDELNNRYGKPDLIITDPPRSGLHPNVAKFLANCGVPRIIYVSCNPTTQARDLDVLCENYTIKKVQPVDMFPHTIHIENVVLLEKNG